MYLISKEGKWGRKSFPTKKHMKTQSSTLLSKLKGKGRLAMVNSRSRYCREMTTSAVIKAQEQQCVNMKTQNQSAT